MAVTYVCGEYCNFASKLAPGSLNLVSYEIRPLLEDERGVFVYLEPDENQRKCT